MAESNCLELIQGRYLKSDKSKVLINKQVSNRKEKHDWIKQKKCCEIWQN